MQLRGITLVIEILVGSVRRRRGEGGARGGGGGLFLLAHEDGLSLKPKY